MGGRRRIENGVEVEVPVTTCSDAQQRALCGGTYQQRSAGSAANQRALKHGGATSSSFRLSYRNGTPALV